jgi:hypothetical protein
MAICRDQLWRRQSSRLIQPIPIKLVVTVLCFWLSAAIHAAATPEVTTNIDPVFAQHGIQVLAYSSSQFQPTLNRLLGETAAGSLISVQPYILLLVNNSGSVLVKAVVRYPRINTSGETIDGDMRYTFGDLLSRSSGSTMILVPEPSLSRTLNDPANRSSSPQSLSSMANAIVSSKFDPARFSKATVSLDSVILADGTVLGPDALGIIGIEKAKSAAETDILAHLEDDTVSDTQLLDWLSTFDARTIPPDSRTGLQNEVQIYKASFAGAVLRFIKEHGRPGTAQWIRSIQSNHTPSVSTLHEVQ